MFSTRSWPTLPRNDTACEKGVMFVRFGHGCDEYEVAAYFCFLIPTRFFRIGSIVASQINVSMYHYKQYLYTCPPVTNVTALSANAQICIHPLAEYMSEWSISQCHYQASACFLWIAQPTERIPLRPSRHLSALNPFLWRSCPEPYAAASCTLSLGRR